MSLGKPPRLQPLFQKYDAPLFFVTLCTCNRKKVLANEAVHAALIEYGKRGVERGVALGRYVIMPDHIHLFVGGDHNFDLGIWVRGLKRAVAAAVLGGRAGGGLSAQNVLPPGRTAATTPIANTRLPKAPLSIWQRGFFDHLIRSGESYEQKWNYVRENPVRARLLAGDENWAFQGEIVVIDRT